MQETFIGTPILFRSPAWAEWVLYPRWGSFGSNLPSHELPGAPHPSPMMVAERLQARCQLTRACLPPGCGISKGGNPLNVTLRDFPLRCTSVIATLWRRITAHSAANICIPFIFLMLLLEYNCFIKLCEFLLCNKVNQTYVCIYPFLLSLPLTHPPPSHPARLSQRTALGYLCPTAVFHQLSIAHTDVIYVNVTLPVRPSPFPAVCTCHSPRLCLYFCPANRFISIF